MYKNKIATAIFVQKHACAKTKVYFSTKNKISDPKNLILL